MIYLTIEGQEMAGILTAPLVSGQVNFVDVKTIFDSTWDDLNKSYQFHNGDVVSEVDSNDEIINLPYEATAYPGTLEINVVGTKLDDDGVTILKKATTNTLRFKVGCCNLDDNPDNCGDVSATVVEQIRQIAESAEDKATEAERISAVIWEAYKSGELNGKDGVVGKDGADGVSPKVETEQTTTGAKITITDVNGTHIAELLNGKDGVDGTMSFEELTEAQKASLKGDPGEPGPAGADGKSGVDGRDGVDGYSPIAKVSQTSTGATITITDKNGTTTANVVNGKDGSSGADGQPGRDGLTPHIGDNGNWWIGDEDTGTKAEGSGSGGGSIKKVLFHGEGVTNTTVTLSDNISNYDFISINVFYDDASNAPASVGTAMIYVPNMNDTNTKYKNLTTGFPCVTYNYRDSKTYASLRFVIFDDKIEVGTSIGSSNFIKIYIRSVVGIRF